MKLTWIEDFLTLIEADTFSRAAKIRNVTQPAFSRRIQMFEEWVGVKLVDRRSHRLKLTETAVHFEPALRRLVSESYELRSRMRAHASGARRIRLTTQHTLVVSHLPRLLRFLKERCSAAFSVRTGNLEDCVNELVNGEAELLMCFEGEGEPHERHIAGEIVRIPIGTEELVPVVAADAAGAPVVDPEQSQCIQLLSYPEKSFLGRVVRDYCMPDLVRTHTVETVCESAFSMALKEMALAGLGVAWLPGRLIERELQDGSLLSLQQTLNTPVLTICVYTMAGEQDEVLNGIWEALKAEPLEL